MCAVQHAFNKLLFAAVALSFCRGRAGGMTPGVRESSCRDMGYNVHNVYALRHDAILIENNLSPSREDMCSLMAVFIHALVSA